MNRKLLFVFVFAMLHTAGTTLLVLLTMGAAMSGFEPGTKPVAPGTWRLLSSATGVLMLPFGAIIGPEGAPGLWGYVLFFANGIVWGTLVLATWHLLNRIRRARALSSRGHR